MDRKKIIIIGIIILIIAAAIILVMLTSVNYERIEITPNGTSIEVPANQTKYKGDVESAKIWNWNNGILVTYNSHEDRNPVKVTELGFNALNDLIKNGERQDIDGYTCYVINADKLANETSHDNLIICCNDKDMAVHMAKSVQYKNVFPDNNKLDNTISKVENMTEDLQSKANDYKNNVDLNDIKSTIENKAGDLLSKSPIKR